ncbi:MAG: hypothetical protein IT290_00500, partial [Deltaproteobacteria bacterium]|nr:hypothetical protein [Deltaproteobacteria bacterium]
MRRKSIVLSLALFTAFSASADEKRFGRLADGKAFRVDDQGLQLVDQMAELQVTVDELNRQITSLEFELAEKDRALLSQGKGVVTTVRPGAAAEAAGAMPAAKGVDTCRAEIDSYQSKLSALENQLRASQALTQTRASCDYESQTRPLREQIATLQQTLKSNTSKVARGEEEQTRRELQISLAQYQDKLSEREAALEAATKKAETSGTKLTEFESQLAALKQQVDTQKSREQE